MAGHSKWANIKHRKSREDAKRGKVFTKLIKEITVAARMGGGDPAGNPRLRAALDRAKAENMPKDNIDRAIKKGTGELEGVNYEEVTYEGYGPGGVAVLVDVLTDNRNRTVAEVRAVFTKSGGNLGESGCVAWNFDKKGLFTFDIGTVDEDELMNTAIEAGAEDVNEVLEDNIIEVHTSPPNFQAVKDIFDDKALKYNLAEISMIPKTTVKLEGGDAQRMLRMMDSMEDCDDVQNVYANFDISSEEIERLSA
jgi:YebC/PmpR family DNA-binding regulatory protein